LLFLNYNAIEKAWTPSPQGESIE